MRVFRGFDAKLTAMTANSGVFDFAQPCSEPHSGAGQTDHGFSKISGIAEHGGTLTP
jgi:hypothetical protein